MGRSHRMRSPGRARALPASAPRPARPTGPRPTCPPARSARSRTRRSSRSRKVAAHAPPRRLPPPRRFPQFRRLRPLRSAPLACAGGRPRRPRAAGLHRGARRAGAQPQERRCRHPAQPASWASPASRGRARARWRSACSTPRGRRRYLDALSTYTRRRIGTDRPRHGRRGRCTCLPRSPCASARAFPAFTRRSAPPPSCSTTCA